MTVAAGHVRRAEMDGAAEDGGIDIGALATSTSKRNRAPVRSQTGPARKDHSGPGVLPGFMGMDPTFSKSLCCETPTSSHSQANMLWAPARKTRYAGSQTPS